MMRIGRRDFLKSSATAASMAMLGLGGGRAAAKTPPAGVQAPAFYRLMVGTVEVTAVNDGMLEIDASLYPKAEPEAAEALLAAAYRPKAKIPTAVNTYVVNTGDTLILVDTGAATAFGPGAGHLAANLAAAGIDPATIDMVCLTHLHPDHAPGLITAEGAAAFPNAELIVAESEHAHWTDDGVLAQAPEAVKPFFQMARAAIAPYAGRMRLIADGAELAAGVTAAAGPGHTPGHTLFRVTSGDAALLIWGDIVHTAALQFARPDWAIAFDVDQDRAIATRRRIFHEVVAERMLVAGMHLDFPGLGNVSRDGAGYRFRPVFWSPTL